MISSSNNCRQLVAGNYDVLLNDDHHSVAAAAAYKSVLKDFLEHFKRYELEFENKSDCCGYVREFKMLKEYSKSLKENKSNLIDGELDINQKKNRYKDIIPFSHTRVILSGNPESRPGANYINANYIRGPSGSQRAYIACQGPLTSTLNDFWRMIWECNVSVVIMACNEYESGKPKCEIYWPEQLEFSQVYQDVQVKLLRIRQINSDFLIRKFSIKLLEPLPTETSHHQFTTTTTNGYFKHRQQQYTNNQQQANDFKNYASSIQYHAASAQYMQNNNNNNNRIDNGNLINGSSTGNSSTSNESINGLLDANEQPANRPTTLIDNHNFMRPDDLSPPLQPPPVIIDEHSHHDHDSDEVDLNQHHTIPIAQDRTVIAERTICQFHYTTWPDHGVPNSVHPILELVRLIREVQPVEDRPILVHCSAGCGRTGTICCIDYVWGLMRRGKLDSDFNLFKIISDMRQQRMAMVQTLEQYILCHRAVATLFMQQLQLIDGVVDGEEEDDDVERDVDEEDEHAEKLTGYDNHMDHDALDSQQQEPLDDDDEDLGPVII